MNIAQINGVCNLKILHEFCLLLQDRYSIIIKHDCDRYAMKREVAAFEAGNFRGVCPILNRATTITEQVVGCKLP